MRTRPQDIQLTGLKHAKEAIADLLNEQTDLVAQRDELLAALEEIDSHCYAGALELHETHPAIAQARAAIAKAKGE